MRFLKSAFPLLLRGLGRFIMPWASTWWVTAPMARRREVVATLMLEGGAGRAADVEAWREGRLRGTHATEYISLYVYMCTTLF